MSLEWNGAEWRNTYDDGFYDGTTTDMQWVEVEGDIPGTWPSSNTFLGAPVGRLATDAQTISYMCRDIKDPELYDRAITSGVAQLNGLQRTRVDDIALARQMADYEDVLRCGLPQLRRDLAQRKAAHQEFIDEHGSHRKFLPKDKVLVMASDTLDAQEKYLEYLGEEGRAQLESVEQEHLLARGRVQLAITALLHERPKYAAQDYVDGRDRTRQIQRADTAMLADL